MGRGHLALFVAVLAIGGSTVGSFVAIGAWPPGAADTDPTWKATPATPPPDDELAVHYLDVGQADATVIEFPNGETMVIDTGDWRQEGSVVLDYLEARSVDRVDHLVATHPHADHVGGHAAVIEHVETNGSGVGAAYDPGVAHTTATFDRYLDAVEAHDVDLFTVRAGDELAVGNATVRFLNPSAEDESNGLHENSVVLTVTFGEDRFLFTGDAEEPVEKRLAENASADVDADVHQVGHHGSETSSASRFLDAVDPSVVVISSALDSQYGHPHDVTLDAFAERGYETYWTAVHGNVTVVSNGSGIVVEPEHEGPTNATELAAERPTESAEPALQPGGFGAASARVIG